MQRDNVSQVSTVIIEADQPLDARAQRASDLKDIFGAIQKLNDGSFLVASQWTPDRAYIVTLEPKSCSCGDFVYRGVDCKHILAVKGATN